MRVQDVECFEHHYTDVVFGLRLMWRMVSVSVIKNNVKFSYPP